MLNRRSLLKTLALAAADPDRLIWEAGRKLFSLPRVVTPTRSRIFTAFNPDGNGHWLLNTFMDNSALQHQFGREWQHFQEVQKAIESGIMAPVAARDFRIPFSVSLGFKVNPRENG